MVHQATYRSTSRLILGQKKCVDSTSSVFLAPTCPINPPPCASCNNKRRTEPAGMHRRLALNKNPSLIINLFYVRPSLQFSNTSLKSGSSAYCSFIDSSPKIRQSSWDSKVYHLDKASAITLSFPFLCLIISGKDSINSTHLACLRFRLC